LCSVQAKGDVGASSPFASLAGQVVVFTGFRSSELEDAFTVRTLA
jgi:hypothetical protein